eukprot:9730220-Prorocentrum_lima.AAC.1
MQAFCAALSRLLWPAHRCFLLDQPATALAAFHALDLPRLVEEDIAAQERPQLLRIFLVL